MEELLLAALLVVALVLGSIALVALRRSRRTAAELSVTLATTQAIVTSASDALIAVAEDGTTVTMWNPAAERIFGWRADEVVGRPLPTEPDEGAGHRAEIFRRVATGERVSIVSRRRRRDGTPVDVRISYSGLTNPDGRHVGMMGVVRDVTAELAANRARTERAELVERLAVRVAGLSTDLGLDAVLTELARSCAELVGAEAAGFVVLEPDGPVVAAVHGLSDEVVGLAVPPGRGLFRRVLAQRVRLQVADYQTWPDRVEEIAVAAPHLHTMVVTPVLVQQRPAGALAAFFPALDHQISDAQADVLDLLADHAGTTLANAAALAEVVRGRAHERAVIDAVVDGIAVIGPDGAVSVWNDAANRLTGLAADQVLGRPLPVAAGSAVDPAEHQLGYDRWVEVVATPLGQTGEQVVMLRDVSRQKALEAAKAAFVASTSHELKTPLTVIKGFSRLLLDTDGEVDGAERQEALEAIAGRADELTRLVEKILLSSRAEAGRADLDLHAVDLRPTLRHATAGFGSVSERHRLVLDLPDHLPPVLADPEDVETALGQLLENAFKYSPAGGAVTVRARATDSGVEVSVTDEGIGLTDEDARNVFSPFYQGEVRRSSRIRGGVGLGLSIVRRLVEAQGGRVWATGEPGTGATFAFELPLA